MKGDTLASFLLVEALDYVLRNVITQQEQKLGFTNTSEVKEKTLL